jgi:signal peptidase I
MADALPRPADETAPEPQATVRRPALALIADTLLPPLGHLYVGEARRGAFLWLFSNALAALIFLPLRVVPGLPMLLVAVIGAAVVTSILPIDAFLIARRRRAGYVLRPYNRWYVYVGTAALVVVFGGLLKEVARTQIQAFRIPSEAMTPSLIPGDYLFIDKVTYRGKGVRRGDIVVFPFPRDPTKDFIKRVVATGGQTIEIRDKRVVVNATALEEPYAVHSDATVRSAGEDVRDNFGPFEVPTGELFVMGDNRDNSNDSRYWGTVPERSVKGEPLLIYWSWDPLTSSARWGRVGMRPR